MGSVRTRVKVMGRVRVMSSVTAKARFRISIKFRGRIGVRISVRAKVSFTIRVKFGDYHYS
jgi:hypothetical protein